MENRSAFRAIIIIVILGLTVYYGSLGGKFIWDDEQLVKNNLRIRSFSSISQIFAEDLGSGAGEVYNFYRPVQTFSYMIDYFLWRLAPQGYHFTNILLHILASLTIIWLVTSLFKDYLLSLVTAVFFVIHPVHTEAVAYISGRADSLALIFMLLCLVFYIKHTESKKISIYLLACLSYIMALLSRESSLILPLLLLLCNYAIKKRVKIRYYLPMLGISLTYILFRITAISSTLPDLSVHPPLLQRIPAFFVAIFNYIKLLLLPLHLHMEYGNKLFNIYDTKAIAGIILVVFLLIYLNKTKRDSPLVFFSLSWFLITLLPVSGIYPMNAYMAEHWLYLPSIGFFLLMSKVLNDMYRDAKFRKSGIAVIAILLSVYSFLTFRQNFYWREPIIFFKRTLQYAPESIKILTNLGNAYRAVGMYEKAINSYRKALEIDPDYATAYYNLGTTYDAMYRREEAAAFYKKAIAVDPEYAKAYNNLGNIYSGNGDIERAIEAYKRAIEISPDYHDAHYNLGNEYRRLGENNKAIISYRRALEINPYAPSTHNNLAVTYHDEKLFDLAIEHCDRAMQLGLQPHPGFLKELEPYR